MPPSHCGDREPYDSPLSNEEKTSKILLDPAMLIRPSLHMLRIDERGIGL